MRNINILRNVNRVVIGLTALLYLTIVFGLLAQVLLGVYQVIIALYLAANWMKLTENNRKKLNLYMGLVGVYLFLWFVPGFTYNEFLWLKIAIVPMSIAVYFTYFLETMNTKRRSVFNLTETN